jgi:hypothetical protein
MRQHTCIACGIEGYSPDGEIPYGWLRRTFTVRTPPLDTRKVTVIVCSTECFADEVNEYEDNGSTMVEL